MNNDKKCCEKCVVEIPTFDEDGTEKDRDYWHMCLKERPCPIHDATPPTPERECEHELTFVRDSKEGAKLYCVKCGAEVKNDPNAVDTLATPKRSGDCTQGDKWPNELGDLVKKHSPELTQKGWVWLSEFIRQLLSSDRERVRALVQDCMYEHNEARHGSTPDDAYERVLALLTTPQQ